MKILSRQQIQDTDEHTIKNEPVPSIELMERAAGAFKKWFSANFDNSNPVAVVCGIGNNGGDGLAVARMLIQDNYQVDIFAVKPKDKTSDDFAVNEERLKKLTGITYISDESISTNFKKHDVIIDGIFGSGLTRPVDHGIYKTVIEKINNSPAKKVAIDIPSGLFADEHSGEGVIVEADHTISFQVPKLAFFFPENYKYVGQWTIVDIGLDQEYIDQLETNNILLEEKHIAWIYNIREKFSHKGNYGKCLLITGSYGKIGAAVLAATAALRSGVGLLTVHTPRCGYSVLQSMAPEAMVSPDEDDKHFSMLPAKLDGYDALGIGPGLGTDELTLSVYAKLLNEWNRPMVIDADGLNLIAKNHHLLDMVPEDSVLTPHPKEFERLAGKWQNDFDRLEKLRSYAQKHEVYVLLKGYHSTLATPEGKVYFNNTGNAGMATGGTGDVLTGIISALLAQKYSPEEAALFGVWLHGLAGDKAAEESGMASLIASDVVKHISAAYKHILNAKKKMLNNRR